MKMINDDLIKYLSGEMTASEMEKFELNLNASPELQRQKKQYEKLLRDIRVTSSVNTNDAYFRMLVPSLRQKLEQRSRPGAKTLRFALSFSSAAAVIIILIFILLPAEQNNMGDVIDKMDQNELSRLINEHDIELTDQKQPEKINEMYEEELSSENIQGLVSEYLYESDLYASLTEAESDFIYKEMIEKELLEN